MSDFNLAGNPTNPLFGDPSSISDTSPYEPIAAWARRRLNQTSVELTTDVLTFDIAIVVATLLVYYPCLGTDYTALSGNDKLFFDKAAGLMTAIAIRPSMVRTTPVTDLVRVTLGNARQFEYADPVQGKKPIEQVWLDEAYASLQLVSCIRAVWLSLRARAHNYGTVRMRSGRNLSHYGVVDCRKSASQNPLLDCIWESFGTRFSECGGYILP